MGKNKNSELKKITKAKYQYGFVSKIDSEKFKPGLNEEIVKKISSKRMEPKWLLDYRIKALNRLKKMPKPNWANLKIQEIDLQKIRMKILVVFVRLFLNSDNNSF